MLGRTMEPAQRRGVGSRKGPNSSIRLELELDPAWHDEDERPVTTEFYRDDSRSILSTNDSADNPFDYSLNWMRTMIPGQLTSMPCTILPS